MPIASPQPLSNENGTTLVELMVALMAGLVIISALAMVILTTIHGSARVTARVEATQRARVALTRLMQELHSACVNPEIAPVKAASTGSTIQFVHQTGSAVSPIPVWSEVSLSGTSLVQQDYGVTGTAPSWARGAAIGGPRTLLTDVGPIPPSSSIFSYYRYENGTIAGSSQKTPLEVNEAALTVEVKAGLRVEPERTPVHDTSTAADITNAATLRLTPPSFNEGSPSKPCS
jgi:hypothetical protein